LPSRGGDVHTGEEVLTADSELDTPVPAASPWYTVQEVDPFDVAKLLKSAAVADPCKTLSGELAMTTVASRMLNRERLRDPTYMADRWRAFHASAS